MDQSILIIDDSHDDILLTQMALARTGRRIGTETALSGEEALSLLRNDSPLPSLILLDLKMPGMDGLGVLREIRNDQRLCRVPVIIVTNSNLESDREACTKAGADSFLHKSGSLERFASDIGDELSRLTDL